MSWMQISAQARRWGNRQCVLTLSFTVGNSLTSDHVPEYQARLGSALWQVDFYLYAMYVPFWHKGISDAD